MTLIPCPQLHFSGLSIKEPNIQPPPRWPTNTRQTLWSRQPSLATVGVGCLSIERRPHSGPTTALGVCTPDPAPASGEARGESGGGGSPAITHTNGFGVAMEARYVALLDGVSAAELQGGWAPPRATPVVTDWAEMHPPPNPGNGHWTGQRRAIYLERLFGCVTCARQHAQCVYFNIIYICAYI